MWERLGVCVLGSAAPDAYPFDKLQFGWYSDWSFQVDPDSPNGAEYAQLIPVRADVYPPDWDRVWQPLFRPTPDRCG